MSCLPIPSATKKLKCKESCIAGICRATDTPAGWQGDVRPAIISEADLLELAADNNTDVINEVKSNRSFVQELWEKSVHEVSQGWAQGPFEAHQPPQDAVISKRFGVEGGPKIRPTDGLKRSMVNNAYECDGKIQVHDCEVIAAALVLMRRSFKGQICGQTIDLMSAPINFRWERKL